MTHATHSGDEFTEAELATLDRIEAMIDEIETLIAELKADGIDGDVDVVA